MQQMIPEFKGLSLADVFSNTQALKAGQMKLDAAQREQEAMEKVRQIYASGRGMDSPDVQREVMAAAPEYGLKMADLQAQLSKSQAEIGKDELEYFRDAAAGIASQFDQLPEDQRTDDNLHRIRDQYAGMVAAANPAWAKKLMAAPLDRNAMYALARSAAKYGAGGTEYFAPIQDEQGNYYQPSKAGGTPMQLGIKGPIHYGIVTTDQGIYRAPTNRSEPAQPLSGPRGEQGEVPRLRPPAGSGFEYDATGKQVPTRGGPHDPTFARQESLRKELQGLQVFKDYTAMLPIASAVRSAATRDTKAADLDIIYGLAKAMDPGSVVRESETQLAMNTGSPAERLKGLWNDVVNGGARLTPEVRKNLMQEFEDRLRGHESLYKNVRADYDRKAQQQGFNPLDVYTNLDGAAPAQPPARPRKYNPKTREAVEWDGKAWVKVQP